MNVRIWILLFLLILTCSGAMAQNLFTPFVPVSAIPHMVDPELDSYVEDFLARSNGQFTYDSLRNVMIGFADIKALGPDYENVIGLCYFSFALQYPKIITIDREFWHSPWTSQEQKWALMFHELGHCAGRLDHTEKEDSWLVRMMTQIGIHHERSVFLDDGCPKSLMYPQLVSTACVRSHQGYYIEELFAQTKKKLKL